MGRRVRLSLGLIERGEAMRSGPKGIYDDKTWNRGFYALLKFKQREGHCRVPRHHVEGGYRLGQWVAVQRYTEDAVSPKRKKQLISIGFVWSRRDWLWEQGIAALKAFKAREGHCYVPIKHIEDGLKLGLWVSTQRRRRITMGNERKRRLSKVGFVWRAGQGNGPPTFADRDLGGTELSQRARWSIESTIGT